MLYSESFAEAGILPSVGSRRDSPDTARAESVVGQFRAELTDCGGPWVRVVPAVLATLDCVE